jgi:hypothetical protein
VLPDAPALPPVRPPTRVGPLRLGRRRELDDLRARVAALARWGVAPCFQAACAAVAAQATWSAVSLWLQALEDLRGVSDPREAGAAAGRLCIDLALAGSPPAVLDRALTGHLRAWGRGELERPRGPHAWAQGGLPGRAALEEEPLGKMALRVIEDALARRATGIVAEREEEPGVEFAEEALRPARILYVEGGQPAVRMQIPGPALAPLVARWLVLAGLDPLPGAGPQAGELDFARVARPSSHGETLPPIALRTELAHGGALRCELRWGPLDG